MQVFHQNPGQLLVALEDTGAPNIAQMTTCRRTKFVQCARLTYLKWAKMKFAVYSTAVARLLQRRTIPVEFLTILLLQPAPAEIVTIHISAYFFIKLQELTPPLLLIIVSF